MHCSQKLYIRNKICIVFLDVSFQKGMESSHWGDSAAQQQQKNVNLIHTKSGVLWTSLFVVMEMI